MGGGGGLVSLILGQVRLGQATMAALRCGHSHVAARMLQFSESQDHIQLISLKLSKHKFLEQMKFFLLKTVFSSFNVRLSLNSCSSADSSYRVYRFHGKQSLQRQILQTDICFRDRLYEVMFYEEWIQAQNRGGSVGMARAPQSWPFKGGRPPLKLYLQRKLGIGCVY